MTQAVLGIIGGSGIYDLPGIHGTCARNAWRRHGASLGRVARWGAWARRSGFLPRHGRGHRIPPSDINYRPTSRP